MLSSRQHLTGTGLIDGHRVRCIEPNALVRFHTGYPPDANDEHDVQLLCARFGIPLPGSYVRAEPAAHATNDTDSTEPHPACGDPAVRRDAPRTATEMVAHALEAPPELLPFLPELLADLDELGSDAEQIAGVVRDLALPPTARVVDLEAPKGRG